MANNTELNTGPFIWGAAQNAAGQPNDTIARTGPDISRETFMDDTFRAFMLLYRSGVWHKGMNADLLDGQHADEFQPICATLTALCALSSYGLVAKTAANTIAARTITASATAGREGIVITNGDGVSGNPEVGLNISGLTADTTLNTTDEFPYRDATSEGNNKIDASNLAAQLAVLGGYATTATAVTQAATTTSTNAVFVGEAGNRVRFETPVIIDKSNGNTSGIGTLASGAHTITQATVGTVFRTEVSTATNDDPTEKFYHGRGTTSENGLLNLFSFTPASDKRYTIEATVNVRQTAGAGTGRTIKIIADVENVGGTVTVTIVSNVAGGTLAVNSCTVATSFGSVTLDCQVEGVAGSGKTYVHHAKIALFGPVGT